MWYDTDVRDVKRPGGEEKHVEEQIITVEIRTRGEKCEMTDAEILEWYRTHILSLFDARYGTPEVEVRLKRITDEAY